MVSAVSLGSVVGGGVPAVREGSWSPHVCTKCAAVEHRGCSTIEQSGCSSIERPRLGSANAHERRGTLRNARERGCDDSVFQCCVAVRVVPGANCERAQQPGAWRLAPRAGRGDQGAVTSSLEQAGQPRVLRRRFGCEVL